MQAMQIATWNVNSIAVREPHVLNWLKKTRVDVLCLQELKTVDEKFPHDGFGNLGYQSICFGEKTYNGVAVIAASKPQSVQKGFKEETEPFARRFMEVEIDPITIINVYIPNGQEVGSDKFIYKLNWIAMLKRHLQQNHNPEQMVVLCGDFNVATEDRDVYDPQALSGEILLSPQERAAIEDLRSWGFVDAYRLKHQDAGHYSWWDYRLNAFKRNMGMRIDHIWITSALVPHLKNIWIDKEERSLERPSDHAPVIAEFDDLFYLTLS